MAFKLSKQESGIKDQWAAKLRKIHQEMTTRAETAQEAVSDLNDAINDYNATLADVQAFVDERKEAWRDEHSDKSENWQHGEKGEAADTLIEAWDSLDLSEVDTVDVPSAPDASHADDLDALPSEAEV
jgi:ABC-type multidrug transport system fused ATPase/permease subunit